jgi:hypothetical protein
VIGPVECAISRCDEPLAGWWWRAGRCRRPVQDHWYSSKKSELTVTSSVTLSLTSTPARNSLSRSHSLSPSISSTGGAPSRVASAWASPLNEPVVISSPFPSASDRAAKVSHSSRSDSPFGSLTLEYTGNDTSDRRYVPASASASAPSMPPSPLLPVR